MPNHETIRELITFDNRILEMVTDDSLLNVAVDDRIDIATIISDREITFDDLKIYSKDIILIIPYISYNEKITNFFDEYYIGYTSVEERDKVKRVYTLEGLISNPQVSYTPGRVYTLD